MLYTGIALRHWMFPGSLSVVSGFRAGTTTWSSIQPCCGLQVLEELDVEHIPMISVWNKVDVCADPEMVQTVASKRDNTVCISAQTGQGLPELMKLVQDKVEQSMMPVNVLVPYAQVLAAFAGHVVLPFLGLLFSIFLCICLATDCRHPVQQVCSPNQT